MHSGIWDFPIYVTEMGLIRCGKCGRRIVVKSDLTVDNIYNSVKDHIYENHPTDA